MLRVLQEEHALSGLFISHLLSRNMRIEEDLVGQLFLSSEKRLARAILLLAHYGNEGKPDRVVPEGSQQVFGRNDWHNRSRVSFFMNRFRKLGFIKYNGGLQVHSSLLNMFYTNAISVFPCSSRHGGAVFPYPQLKLPVRAMRSEKTEPYPSASSNPDRSWQDGQVQQIQRVPNAGNNGDHWEYELISNGFARGTPARHAPSGLAPIAKPSFHKF